MISQSPTDTQPVFDTIAASATRLCNGVLGGVYRFDGSLIHFVAHHNWTEQGLDTVRQTYPRAPSRETQIATAILDRRVVEVRDFENDPDVPTASVPLAQALGYRPRYVSAFPSRRVFRRFVEDIAWSTQVWIANEAEQVISFGTAP